MRKHLLTTFIILLSAALIALGVLMPKITFSYQNTSLLAQVENDPVDRVSFMDYSDNEAFNALQMIATFQYSLISDERDSDMDTRRQFRKDVSSFMNLLRGYADDYTVNYGYSGQVDFFNSTLYFYAPEPCLLTNDDIEYEVIPDDNDNIISENMIYNSNSNSATTGTDDSEWDDRPVWLLSSYSRTRNSKYQYFVIDDTSGKIVSFSIYEDNEADSFSFTTLDMNEYIYIFTNLFTDYYNLTVLSYQSDCDEPYLNEEGEEVFDYFNLYFTVSDSATSETSVMIMIFISYDSVCFNESY